MKYVSPSQIRAAYFELRLSKLKKKNNKIKPKPFSEKIILRKKNENKMRDL